MTGQYITEWIKSRFKYRPVTLSYDGPKIKGIFDCSFLNSWAIGSINILTCHFPFDEQKIYKCSNQKVYVADAVLASKLSEITEICNRVHLVFYPSLSKSIPYS